jgi:hypothetical protein
MNLAPESTPDSGMIEKSPDLSTTARLFPDYMEEDTPLPIKEEQAPPVQKEETSVEEPPVTEPKYLTPEEFGDQMVKVKIDGVEREVPFRDVVRGYQTDQHLSQKGNKIAQERQTLEEIRRSIAQPQTTSSPTTEVDPLTEILQPYIKPFQDKIQSLESMIAEVSVITGPAKYQANLQKVDARMKGEGFDDFMTYVPKIEDFIRSLPEDEQLAYDNPLAFIDLYKTQKLKDQLSKKEPVKHADQRPTPPVTKIEPSSGTPTGTDNWQGEYNTAFNKAKKTGDWTEVLRLKGAI